MIRAQFTSMYRFSENEGRRKTWGAGIMWWAGLNGLLRKSRFERVSAKRWLDEVRAMQRAVREASIHGDGRRERMKPSLLGSLTSWAFPPAPRLRPGQPAKD